MQALFWTGNAMRHGGTLTLRCAFPGNKALYLARMEWAGEKPVIGRISTSPEGALDQLETAIREDAADEMVRDGKA